jgi:hypothetical protein
MALSGSQKAYLQARSGIARSAAIRSNYVWPLYAYVTVAGVDLTHYVQYGTLHVTQQLNEQPDTASFDVMLTDTVVADAIYVGADVLIGLGGPAENAVFGGRVLTWQDTVGPARTPRVRSVMCADYLQVLDSEYLITYDWPPQSATVTILDLMARFANKPDGVPISTAGVRPGLPSHASVAVANERFSTLLRRLVTMFPDGGGFYVDPLKVLNVWAGASEPNVVNPQQLTLGLATLKQFAQTNDNSQQRDAVIVEGLRTTAPIGIVPDPATDPAFLLSVPVLDASILDKVTDAGARREVRIGTQRLLVQYAEGVWTTAPGAPQTAKVVTDVGWPPSAGTNWITVDSTEFLRGRNMSWVRIDEQYLDVLAYSGVGVTPAFIQVKGTGWGGLIGPIYAGAIVTAIDSFGDIVTTGRYDVPGNLERIRPQPIDADVVMVVRSAYHENAIHEQIVQDGRFSRGGAEARGLQEVFDFKQQLTSIAFDTEDLNAKPGRLQTYNLVDPVVSDLLGDYMILTTDLTWPVWGQPPRRHCQAADVHAANIVDTWLTDPR